MGTVRSLNPTQGLGEFLSFLYGEEEGYVHVPIKNPETDKYEYDFFFKWPAQRQDIIEHVARHSKSVEVYITPGMFKTQSSSVAESHGSYVAWCDFDGNVPSLEELKELHVPMPTLRVQSSVPGREHWYWRYDQFNNDIAAAQGINKAICYAFGADFAWDMGHSLRPVGSINHKRGGVPVVIKSHNTTSYRIEDFGEIPIPQDSYNVEQFRKEQIPNPLKTIMKRGPWSDEAAELFNTYKIAEGNRSSALTKFAYLCLEHGLDNSEAYSLVQWVDKRWRKFADRYNKEKYYVDLINYARQKVPYEGIKDVTVLADELKLYDWDEIVEYVDSTEWIIPGILPAKGKLFIVGRSGTGKTTLALGLTSHLALSKKHLNWESPSPEPKKILFLSLEMLVESLTEFWNPLNQNFSTEEQSQLKKYFKTYASPEKIKFYKPESPMMGKFLRTLENHKPDVILVDSASFSLASNLSNQEEITKAIETLDQIQDRYDCSFIFIHHSRKEPPNHGYKEADLDDVFGSAFIAASASSIISLKPAKDYSDKNQIMDLKYLKVRFQGANEGFSVVMDGERRIFNKPTAGALPPPRKSKEESSDDGNRSFFSI
jgi:KaiC/GvpD/RAD55 family RecA-like ATPase